MGNRSSGAPHLARFSRDVGYHGTRRATLSVSLGAQPSGSAVRHWSAPLLPVHDLHLSSTEHSWKHPSPLFYSGFPRVGRRTTDPLGCARDDKKERTVARKGRFLNRGILNSNLDTFEVQPSLR